LTPVLENGYTQPTYQGDVMNSVYFAHTSLENAAPPVSDFTGLYPPSAKDTKAGMNVAVLGAGDVFQKMIRPVFQHLGISCQIYDTNESLSLAPREVRVEHPKGFDRQSPVFILTPPRLHVQQVIDCISKQKPFYCEKPIGVTNEEMNRLEDIMQGIKTPGYFGDFHYFMGLAMTSLMGVNMPYKNTLEIVSDETGKIAEALRTGTPLIERVKRVVGHYMMGATTVGGTVEGRVWLDNRRAGGGMLTDLMPHFTNNCALMGMRVHTISSSELKMKTDLPGVYTPIAKGDTESTEYYAKVTGTLTNGADFEFEVAKYAAKNDLFLELEGGSGEKLRLDYLPPNRKNSVTFLGSDGGVQGEVKTTIDPYFLTISHALEHFDSREMGALFFSEQAETVRVMERMDEVGRK
jgi:predicted dehydrogenase